jgi:hypothetical protein
VAGLDIRILLEYNPCCSAPLKKGGLAVLGLLTSGSIYEFRIILNSAVKEDENGADTRKHKGF